MHRLNYAKKILGPCGDVMLAFFRQTLALWIGRSGSVALVSGRVRSSGEQLAPASIMLTSRGLTVSSDHPSANEIDRLAGIERAIEAVAKARAAARASVLPSVPGGTF